MLMRRRSRTNVGNAKWVPFPRSLAQLLNTHGYGSARQGGRTGGGSRLGRLSVFVLNGLPGVGVGSLYSHQYADNIGLSVFYIIYAFTEGPSSRSIRSLLRN